MGYFLISLCMLLSPATTSLAQEQELQFEQRVYTDLLLSDTRGINPKYLDAIAMLETGYGGGYVYQHTNNLFSIQADDHYMGKTFTGIYRYRVYSSFSDSIDDVILLLTTRSRYRKAYKYALMDERKKFFQALKDAGYSEDLNYAKKLEKVFQDIQHQEIVKRFSQYKVTACSINNDSPCKTPGI